LDIRTIQQARQTNLAEYLLGVNVPLVKNGSRYRHKEHDSLVFTRNAYYWNSRAEHGNAIDYLVRHMNMGFVNAVLALAKTPKINQAPTQPKIFEINETELNNSHNKVKLYLRKNRFIGITSIDWLINKRLLFQERQTNNAFFLIRDENDNCVGAEIQGTADKRFKGIKANSKYGYGFNVRFTDDGTFDYALFFESAIDLISFMDYKHVYEGKGLERCALISMAGLKMNVLKHSLQVFDGVLIPPKVVLCVDNDNAGLAFKKEVKRANIPYIDRSPHPNFKDWNEQLADTVRSQRPIGRLMSYSAGSRTERFGHDINEQTILKSADR
jgi:hypothetical protein